MSGQPPYRLRFDHDSGKYPSYRSIPDYQNKDFLIKGHELDKVHNDGKGFILGGGILLGFIIGFLFFRETPKTKT